MKMGLFIFLALLGALTQGSLASYINQMVFPDVSTFYSGPLPDYSRFPLSVYDRDFVTFKLRACGEGRILIHATKGMGPRDSHVAATEIAIGSPDENTITVREPKEGPVLYNVTTDLPVLACGELRQFWISWKNWTLQMGRGPIFQQQVLLDMKKPNSRLINVDTLFFATAEGQTGVWQLDDNAGVTTLVRTQSTEGFTDFWKTVEHHSSGFIFVVKAEHDANIALGAVQGYADYTIVLGADNNQRCHIKKGEEIVFTYEEANQTSALEYRPFWVTWHGGLVEVGLGKQPGQMAIMDFKDSYFKNVGHVGLGTGNGANGDWVIKQDTENEIAVSTPEKPRGQEYDFFVTAPRSRFIQFHVAACSDASIIFTKNIGFGDDNTLYVTLGADNNTKTTIGTGYTPVIKEYPTKDLLKCDIHRAFWVSWRTGQLRVGSGVLVNSDLILSYSHSIVSDIMVVGFSNRRPDIPAHFTVADIYGDVMGYVAQPSLDYGSIWMTTRQEYFRVFNIMQCGGSQLLLAEAQNTITNGRYQVIFSVDGSKVTLKWDLKEKSATLSPKLECMEKRTFWLSWYDNEVRLGEGHRYNENLLLQLNADPKKSYPVNVLTVANMGEQAAEWEVEMEQDNMLSIKMAKNSESSDIRWYRLYENTDWMFVRLANEDSARMVLSMRYRDATMVTHEISFCEDGKNNIIARKDGVIVGQANLTSSWRKTNLRDFWMSWEEGNLIIGESKFRGQDKRMTIPYTEDAATAALGFYPGKTGDIEWQLHNSFGPEATLITEAGESNMNWVKIKHSLNSLVFTVDSCTQASLNLTDRVSSTEIESYIINFSNDRSYIGKGGQVQVWLKTPNLIACSEEYFWLTWYGGTVSVGHGDQIGEQVLLTWHDATPSFVNAFTISSEKSQGKWRLGFMGALPPRPPKPPVPSSRLSGGAIAGIVIGSLVLVAIVTFIIYVVKRGLPHPLQRFAGNRESGVTTEPSFNNPISNQQPEY